MKRVITYGTYDLLHQGHINLLRRAKELDDYLIAGVTSDSFDRGRGKLNVRNNVLERVEAVKATGCADEVIIEDYLGLKIDDIQKYDVDFFAIGSDLEGRFDYLNEYSEVVNLPRTEGISSTKLRAESQDEYRIGIIGSGRIAHRFEILSFRYGPDYMIPNPNWTITSFDNHIKVWEDKKGVVTEY
jgi:glycerol-3-phosphate cytidylyltransferase